MAIHFDDFYFGSVTINDKAYRDVLVIGEVVEERDEARLNQEGGGHHFIGDFEAEKLLSNQPEVIIIGKGTAGVVDVNDKIKKRFRRAGVELKILLTPRAIQEFNKLYAQGKKVNALIHVTC